MPKRTEREILFFKGISAFEVRTQTDFLVASQSISVKIVGLQDHKT